MSENLLSVEAGEYEDDFCYQCEHHLDLVEAIPFYRDGEFSFEEVDDGWEVLSGGEVVATIEGDGEVCSCRRFEIAGWCNHSVAFKMREKA